MSRLWTFYKFIVESLFVKYFNFLLYKLDVIFQVKLKISGFEFRLTYSQNASDICKLRVTFIQARKILLVAFSRRENVKTKLE